MTHFNEIKYAVANQMKAMSKHEWYRTDVSGDELWETYLASFPEGTNPIFRERTEHDCSCCRQFIRTVGNVVIITDDKLMSIWDVTTEGHYQIVADAMAEKVKSRPISGVFRHYENNVGTDHNYEHSYTGTLTWTHFHAQLPAHVVMSKLQIDRFLGERQADLQVFTRGMNELTLEAASIVLELIDQNSLYRGEEHRATVSAFIGEKQLYDRAANKDLHLIQRSTDLGSRGRFRNTVIGTLITDISEGVDLEKAVKAFEAKVAPANYKRPKALITKGMIEKAQQAIIDAGLEDALPRRHAVTEDITVNNVLFADRTAKKLMGESVFDDLIASTADPMPKLDTLEEVPAEKFFMHVLPHVQSIELLLENRLTPNLVSLIAPVNTEAGRLFQWNNNFSWTYNGGTADSMKERVKASGGKVDGVLRFSIQWNTENDNPDDLDAHCVEPNGNHIYFGDRQSQSTGGNLDVDITRPKGTAVENITWPDESRMRDGRYRFYVHDFSARGARSGFTAEIEYKGQRFEFSYPKPLRQGQEVTVAIAKIENGEMTFIESLDHQETVTTQWGIKTSKFHRVSMIMNSPNHWDGQTNGNRHWFFMLDQCINPEPARGFYNEFLGRDLTPHRKVLEVLGSRMLAPPSEHQLSGVGFSSTVKNNAVVRVKGNFNRTLKIIF